MNIVRLVRRTCACGFVASLIAGSALAEEPCEPLGVPQVGRLVSVEGRVEVQRAEDQPWLLAELNQALCRGDTIRVGERSRAAAALINDAVLRIDQNTTLRLLSVTEKVEEPSLFSLILGAFQSFSRRPRVLEVNTPYLNAAIEGTEFVIRVEAAQTLLTVFEGQVAATNDLGRLVLVSGESAVAEAGKAPEPRIVVRPRDAVQWALHYPPVLAVLGGRTARVPAEVAEPLREAIELAGRGDVTGAFGALERVPAGRRDAQFHLFRAALLLSVGRVDEARADIDRALAQDPKAGLAFALRAVIKVVQNEKDQALADALQAVELSPRVAAAKIALSYAQQAKFQLEDARDTLLQAVEEQPEDALAWARLAELWLSLGYRGRALDAAEKAAQLEPDLARVQLVLGFAALTEFRTTKAKAAFERAIALNSADPLPRLGLGLAKIRESDLEAGRKDIEVAVGLDSGNALLRAYLGKAYFEEKRAPLDADQFAIAKELDPLDPTAYLYDAIRKQSENKPGEALDDLQASIARNDNRAVYRGRLQLDQDRAARGTSLARIYDDLGFTQLGVNEASKSLALDPANASAHRFLSDTYGGIRRREIARVSELLQAQLMQDINLNPVQPSISETNLNIITSGGPAEPGFNEFTPLFERNQVQLNASGQIGNQSTLGGEAVVSALFDRFSISAGAFHFDTDGFRANNDLRHDIYNLFAQAAITPELNIQAEFRRLRTDAGDLELQFDPDQFLLDKQRKLDQDVARIGLRYSLSPRSDVLVSFIHSDREERLGQTEFDIPVVPGVITIDVTVESQLDDASDQVEAQYLYRGDRFNVTAGLGYSNVDSDLDASLTTVTKFFGVPIGELVIPQVREADIKHYRGYVYANVNVPDPVTWTLGVSYDDYNEIEAGGDVTKVNAKAGVQWDITEALRLRAAVFSVVKPALAANQVIEPTQVAGFNQFFDDVNATESFRYGVGVDWRLTEDLSVGAEATWRDLDEPVLDIANDVFVSEDRDEQLHRAYLYWTPLPELALSGEFVYDRYKSEAGLDINLPRDVKTISVPLVARYFHHSGLFAGASATYVRHQLDRLAGSSRAEGTDRFFVVDAAVGYRFPNRLGVASLEVRNLFDKKFSFQDDTFREFSDAPSIGPYIPERTILGRITLSF